MPKANPKKFLTVVIDGVFFQLNNTGIARVWHSLLETWIRSGFAQHLILLDRNNTAPKILGITYRIVEPYDYRFTSLDSTRLQAICDEVQADVFISTYYTTPLSTPTVFIAHDMVPEVIQLDLNELCWQEKHNGILQAAKYITVSQNTARDLLHFFPHISPELVTVAHCGVSESFKPSTEVEIYSFRTQYNIKKPYFLTVGSRLSLKNYKNAILLFKALAQLPNCHDLAVVCVGGEPQLEPELKAFCQEIEVHLLTLEDADLKLAYSSAIALVYPSKYEGFGLPIVEAMACNCPVITCHNSSIPEVAGKAALYVDEDDVEEAIKALETIQKPEIREQLIHLGSEQVKQFSWEKMADRVAQILLETAVEYQDKPPTQAALIWQAFRKEQGYRQQESSLVETVNQLSKENQQLSQTIQQLEQEIAYLSTTKAAIRKLIKILLKKIGLSGLVGDR
ncbi:MAG: glycosyltransferase [Cyanobacteria bacterium P01_G01_bin.49]